MQPIPLDTESSETKDRRKIRVKFVDQCWDQTDRNNFLYPVLTKLYDVELVDRDPDYLFCSVFGREHLKYDCVKILYSGENLAPDFNWYDYAIGFDNLSFGDRYLRFPLYAFYPAYSRLADPIRTARADEELLNRGFCSFVVSNPQADPIRDRFFERLSKYRRVDSGGRHLNNVGAPVADKLAFCAKYKFNLAFENSDCRGYTTEKIVEPLSVGSVPVYWGNPEIDTEFNPACMVRVRDAADVERAVEEIVALDRDDAAYLAKCRAPALLPAAGGSYLAQLETFLRRIIDQPIEDARRLAKAGRQPIYRLYQRHAMSVYDFLRRFVPKR